MLRLVLILVLGLMIVPYMKGDDLDETQTSMSTVPVTSGPGPTTAAPPSPTTEPPSTTQPPTTLPPRPTMTSEIVQTTMTSPGDYSTDSSFTFPTVTDTTTTPTTTTTTTTTTNNPFPPIFECDFTGPCFGGGSFQITYGYEFDTNPLTNTSQPPRAPTSDAISTINPTSNNKKCKLPYRPNLDNSTETTNWDMWFCHNEACPTENGEEAECVIDQYGLISLTSTDKTITVTDPLTPMRSERDASGEQCLRFYYYFTVYDGVDWGQQIRLWIKSNSSDTLTSIGTLTINDMQVNKWHLGTFPFSRSSLSDKLQIDFVVENRPSTDTTNREINFAMDVVRLYDANCSYVEEQVDGITRPPPTAGPDGGKDGPNLALILGLSLGIGIPVLLLIVGGIAFVVIKKNRGKKSMEYQMKDRSEGNTDSAYWNNNPNAF